jgi:hypothetical protein
MTRASPHKCTKIGVSCATIENSIIDFRRESSAGEETTLSQLNTQQSLEIVISILALAVVAAISAGVYFLFCDNGVPVQHGYGWKLLAGAGFCVVSTAYRVWKQRDIKFAKTNSLTRGKHENCDTI